MGVTVRVGQYRDTCNSPQEGKSTGLCHRKVRHWLGSAEMKAQFIDPFVSSASEVLDAECGVTVTRNGKLTLTTDAATPMEVTAMIGVTGDLAGIALYSMSKTTALALFSTMLGEEATEFDDLARSAIGELGNMITGKSAVLLEKVGYSCDLTPPSIIEGQGTLITSVQLPKLVMPLTTESGEFLINIGLREG
jgi:chemotaxis protein CheX